MRRTDRALHVMQLLYKEFPSPTTELVHSNPFELLIATILSAQCTDKRVNMVTPDLFQAYPTPELLAASQVGDVIELIRTVNYYRTKAERIIETSRILATKHEGTVPQDRSMLEELPGVGRKTANVVLANAFKQPAFAVDTHVHRVSNRLGLAVSTTVEETEKQLMRAVPKAFWIDMHHLLILHGRKTCKALRPACERCRISHLCKYYSGT